MMADFQSTWAIVTGVLGILTIIPGSLLYIHSQLPSQKLRPMFEALKEADDLLFTCIEEGLVYGANADTYRSTLDVLRMCAEGARFEAHAARTYTEDVANWAKGLSKKIKEICWQVRDVRADISSTSLRERERQASLRQRTTTDTGAGQAVVASSDSERCESLVSSATTCAVASPGDSADDPEPDATMQPHTPAHHTTAVQSQTMTSSSYHLATLNSPGTAPDVKTTSSLSIATSTTTESLPKKGHSDRRYSVSIVSSAASSLQSMRQKKRGGDPLSRARTMARFVRRARAARSPPVFIVDPHCLAAFELVDTDDNGGDDDSDWVDEQAVRIVA